MIKNISTGGGITVSFNSARTDTNQTASSSPRSINPVPSVQFTQPFWRNRRVDQTRGNIKLVNLDLKTNDSKFKQSVTNTIASIQGLYWDLVGAIRDYEIKRKSVELAHDYGGTEQNQARDRHRRSHQRHRSSGDPGQP